MSVLPHLEVLSVSTTASSPNATANNVDLTAAPLMLKKGDWLIGPGICIPIKSLTKSGVNTVIELEWGAPATLSTTRMLIYRVDDSSRLLDAQTQMLVALASNMVTAMKSLTPAANKFPYFDAAGAAQLGDITAAARDLLDDASVGAMRTTLGVVSGSATSVVLRGVFAPSGFATADLTPAQVSTLIGGSGFYEFADTNGMHIQFPSGFPQSHGVIRGYVGIGNAYSYTWQELTGIAGNRKWMRRAVSAAAWGPWSEVYHQSNILGTVSQSAGVPTGAIIQRGSNANGEFVRFADGTQICSAMLTADVSATTAVGVLFIGATAALSFPAVFAAVPHVARFTHRNGGASSSGFAAAAGDGDVTTSTVRVAVYSPVSITNAKVGYVAVGRWF